MIANPDRDFFYYFFDKADIEFFYISLNIRYPFNPEDSEKTQVIKIETQKKDIPLNKYIQLRP